MDAFRIHNPYSLSGTFRKAQLHLHTSNSADVPKNVTVRETIEIYKNAGYSFLVVTDHDKITEFYEFNSPDFLVIPGEEATIYVIWRFGPHLIRIGITKHPHPRNLKKAIRETVAENGLLLPAHPNWGGAGGLGRWYLGKVLQLKEIQLLEIYNRHSVQEADILLWHKLLQQRGYRNPIWCVAVDDSDNGKNIDRGWIMVKTADVSREALFDALKCGNFYATTGPLADFSVAKNVIQVTAETPAQIRFIDRQNKILASSAGKHGSYQPSGDEGFVRVEIIDAAGKTAWSQPFFIQPI